MSYILDALKRADAERERGHVPGLHARPLATPATPGWRRSPRRLWLALELTAALALGAVGLWVWLASPGPAPVTLAVAPPVAPVPAPDPVPVATAVTAQPVLPVAALPAPAPLPTVKLASARTAPPASATKAANAAATPASAPPPLVPLLGELPQDIQRQLPALAISGAVYSKDPAQRLLLVNGQVVTQGAPAAPDLTLEEIGVRSSIFSFHGTRFRLAH